MFSQYEWKLWFELNTGQSSTVWVKYGIKIPAVYAKKINTHNTPLYDMMETLTCSLVGCAYFKKKKKASSWYWLDYNPCWTLSNKNFPIKVNSFILF